MNRRTDRSPKEPSRLGKDVRRIGLGVVAGGMMFVGQAEAGVLVNESFESSPSPTFGAFSSYAYAQNYTSVNIPPGAGARYFTGTSGQAQQTHTGTVNLTDAANGLPATLIDAGLAKYNLGAYFSTYTDQNDFSAVQVQFNDENGSPLGDLIQVGGSDFVRALEFGPNGAGDAGFRDFGLDSTSGNVPVGARTADISIFTQRLVGNAADGYLDLVSFSVAQTPEPGAAVVGLGAAALFGMRRRRKSADARRTG